MVQGTLRLGSLTYANQILSTALVALHKSTPTSFLALRLSYHQRNIVIAALDLPNLHGALIVAHADC